MAFSVNSRNPLAASNCLPLYPLSRISTWSTRTKLQIFVYFLGLWKGMGLSQALLLFLLHKLWHGDACYIVLCHQLKVQRSYGGRSRVYDPQRKMGIRARAAFVKHQITLSSSAVMKSDYPESPAARNNIWELGRRVVEEVRGHAKLIFSPRTLYHERFKRF